MEQQSREINDSIGSTIVGGSITALAAFLGGLIGGELGMAAAGTAAAIIVSKFIKPFRSLLSVIDLKWIMAKIRSLNFPEGRLKRIIQEVLSLISALVDYKTTEDRLALVKEHVVIPSLSYIISRAIPFIFRQLLGWLKFFV